MDVLLFFPTIFSLRRRAAHFSGARVRTHSVMLFPARLHPLGIGSSRACRCLQEFPGALRLSYVFKKVLENEWML